MNQRERFEAAFKAHVGLAPNDKFMRDGKGNYLPEGFGTQSAWEGFQLGEASGLELAAQKCDEVAYDESGYCIDPDIAELGESIRAILAREGA